MITLGCRVNQLETERLRREGLARGFHPAVPGEPADLVIFNTCSVTVESERQARQAIRRTVRDHPGARVVVTGCYAQRDPATLAAIPGVARVLGNAAKHDWSRLLADPLPIPVPAPPPRQGGVFEDYARAFLNVQNGCDQRCTFCVIPALRGPGRSLPPDQVLDQARHDLDLGFQELVLTGINLGAYGRDLAAPIALADLVERLLTIIGPARLRLSSISPSDLTDPRWTALVAHPRCAPYLHLSIQAGDDLILKRMGRPYTRSQVLETIATLRRARSDLILGADLIVGFPTETPAAFRATLALVRDGDIVLPHVFRYSPRPGTPAAASPPGRRVDPRAIRDRSRTLRQAGEELLARTLDRQIGRCQEVLVEQVIGARALGKSGGFLPVICPAPAGLEVGSLLPVMVTGWQREGMMMVAVARE